MKSYVINLDRYPDRLGHVTQEFERLGLGFERIAAFDGSLLEPSALPTGLSHLSRGEVGCLLSHREAWRRVAESRAPYAAILEDDIHLAEWAGDFLADDEWVPPDADVIKLETMRSVIRVSRKAIPTRRSCTLSILRSPHMGSAGYVIARKAAQLLLERNISAPSDTVLFSLSLGEMTVFQLDPALCIQNSFHPDDAVKSEFLVSRINHERKQMRRLQSTRTARFVEKTANSIRKRLSRLRNSLIGDGDQLLKVIPYRRSNDAV